MSRTTTVCGGHCRMQAWRVPCAIRLIIDDTFGPHGAHIGSVLGIVVFHSCTKEDPICAELRGGVYRHRLATCTRLRPSTRTAFHFIHVDEIMFSH